MPKLLFQKGHPPYLLQHSEKTKMKISKSMKRVIFSDEHRKNLSVNNCKYWLGKKRPPRTKEWTDKIKLALTGRKLSEERKQRLSKVQKEYYKNHPFTVERRKQMSERQKGSKSHFWKGGIDKLHHVIRNSFEYKLWRESVFKRDNFTCVFCKKVGGTLHADHIRPFSLFPELRFAIDNGRTLCIKCHKKTDSYAYGFKKSFQLEML